MNKIFVLAIASLLVTSANASVKKVSMNCDGALEVVRCEKENITGSEPVSQVIVCRDTEVMGMSVAGTITGNSQEQSDFLITEASVRVGASIFKTVAEESLQLSLTVSSRPTLDKNDQVVRAGTLKIANGKSVKMVCK